MLDVRWDDIRKLKSLLDDEDKFRREVDMVVGEIHYQMFYSQGYDTPKKLVDELERRMTYGNPPKYSSPVRAKRSLKTS